MMVKELPENVQNTTLSVQSAEFKQIQSKLITPKLQVVVMVLLLLLAPVLCHRHALRLGFTVRMSREPKFQIHAHRTSVSVKMVFSRR